jgi:hypothetical protein
MILTGYCYFYCCMCCYDVSYVLVVFYWYSLSFRFEYVTLDPCFSGYPMFPLSDSSVVDVEEIPPVDSIRHGAHSLWSIAHSSFPLWRNLVNCCYYDFCAGYFQGTICGGLCYLRLPLPVGPKGEVQCSECRWHVRTRIVPECDIG